MLNHGQRYLERVYTVQELHDCGGDPRRLAERFAAKEAAMKVLRRADESIPWRSIEVRRMAGGAPSLELSGPAADLAHEQGIATLTVSLARGKESAAAVVLAELGGGA